MRLDGLGEPLPPLLARPATAPAVAGVSFIASPVPTPSQTRPGYRQPSVANAWATTAGW